MRQKRRRAPLKMKPFNVKQQRVEDPHATNFRKLKPRRQQLDRRFTY